MVDARLGHPVRHRPADHVAGRQLVDEALAPHVAQQRPVARGAPRRGAAGASPGGAAPSGGTGRTRRRRPAPRPAAPSPSRRRSPRAGWWSPRTAGRRRRSRAPRGRRGSRPAHRWAAGRRTPRHRPPSTIRSSANQRSSTAPADARVAATRARSTSAPVAAPPAWTMRGRRVAALAGERQVTGRLAVEGGAHRDQLVDPRRALVDEHPHGVDVAQPRTGGQRVGQVQVGRVLVAAEHRRDAALGPAGRGLGELALGQHPDVRRARAVGEADRRREAGDAAANDEHVEGAGAPAGARHRCRRGPARGPPRLRRSSDHYAPVAAPTSPGTASRRALRSATSTAVLSIRRTGPTSAAMISRSGRCPSRIAGVARSRASTTAA